MSWLWISVVIFGATPLRPLGAPRLACPTGYRDTMPLYGHSWMTSMHYEDGRIYPKCTEGW
jgi:hypothetical protein